MVKGKYDNFLSILAAVFVWATAILFILLFIFNCTRPQFLTVSLADSALTEELDERRGTVDWSQLTVDSQKVVRLAANIDSLAYIALKDNILRQEKKAGRLLTAEQMSDRITGYYDKLIDVLIALFVIFSASSYFFINNKFKKKYEEDKTDIIDSIKKSLIDSQSLHEDMVNGISTKIEKSMITEEKIQDIRSRLDKNDEYFELLSSVCDELTETAAAKEVIVDTDEDDIQKIGKE